MKRALSDFGIESSFAVAAKRFNEHYHFDISPSAALRSTKKIADEAIEYIEEKIANPRPEDGKSIEKMLVELDGCEIRTGQLQLKENTKEKNPCLQTIQNGKK